MTGVRECTALFARDPERNEVLMHDIEDRRFVPGASMSADRRFLRTPRSSCGDFTSSQ